MQKNRYEQSLQKKTREVSEQPNELVARFWQGPLLPPAELQQYGSLISTDITPKKTRRNASCG